MNCLSHPSFRPSAVALFAALLLTACASAPTNIVAPIIPAKAGITGTVHGGQQSVSGSTIQLWAVGSGGDGSASTPLLSPAVVTDVNGNFSITGLYTCPSASSLVYLTASGGNPGLAGGTNNTALAMMAALGTCGSLGPSTYLIMNEVTTVGTVFALAPYMTSYSAIGYGSDLTAITSAFNQVNEFVNIANGTASGPALTSGYAVSITQINTLADLIATCINTSGSLASGTPCTNLFALTGSPTTVDTIAAALYIAQNPTANLNNLLNLVSPSPPFQPQLLSAPSSWALTIQQQVATPTISPTGGIYTSAQRVIISDTTPNVAIHYTLDGTTPTGSSTPYFGSFTVSSSETINAIAVLQGTIDSPVASATFTINPSATSGIITTVAGSAVYGNGFGFSGDGGLATAAQLASPIGVALDNSGNMFIADLVNYRVREVNSAGIISTVAGSGGYGFSGDGGQATSADMTRVAGVAVDASGNLFIADLYNYRVRKVTPAGIISTFAGNGSQASRGGGGQATSFPLSSPTGLAVDASGNVYIADGSFIRKVTPAGVLTTVAGGGLSLGDGGQATSAQIGANGVAVDSSGNIYIPDFTNHRIRKVNSAGIISTVAGNGTAGFTGDGGQATSAEIQASAGIAVDSTGNLYFGDGTNNRVRQVSTSGIISTVAGNGTNGFSGDGGQAIRAELGNYAGLGFDSSDNLYIADQSNNRIRKVGP